MIIVAASPSADWTAAELKENENQENGSKGEKQNQRHHALRNLQSHSISARGCARSAPNAATGVAASDTLSDRS